MPNTYKILLRKDEKTLKMMEDTCTANNAREADEIFQQRHGAGKVVAGPFKIDPATGKRI